MTGNSGAAGEERTVLDPQELLPLYARVYQNSQEAIMITDRNARIVRVNPSFSQITGYEEHEVIGCKPNLLKSDYQSPEFYVRMWAAIHRDGKWKGEIWNRRKNGEVYPQWLSITAVRDAEGELLNYVGMFLDLTDRKTTVSKLRLHAQVFSHASEGIMITDKRMQILSVNQAFTAVTGYTEEEACGRTPAMLQSGVQDRDFYIRMWESIHEMGRWQGEIWNRRKNGEVYPEWLSITTLRDEDGEITHYIGMFTDITERKRTEDRLMYMAHYDNLTGLPNRALLFEMMDKVIAGSRRSGDQLAVLFLDLDRFKNVNDSLGHDIGDKLLRQVSAQLKQAVRSDDIVSRLGGDEFILVLRNLQSADEAADASARLIAMLKRPFHVQGNEIFLEASVGISLYPKHGGDLETLVKHADLAMYQAKLLNSGYRLFDERISSAFLRKLELERELRFAIERKQLYLVYQPQLGIGSGQLEGMEALLRWHHPDLGTIAPGEFIPIAEETGIIRDIGRWVLEEVCRQLGAWSASFSPPSVSVNLSAKQFSAPDLVSGLQDIVQSSACDPRQIVIEITESLNMNDIEAVIGVLHEMKALGFRIAIDDFGKGYSALGYLKQFPIDILKIDKSFVQELDGNARSGVITQAIIDMAHGMDLRVVAEGVETQEQFERLREMGCDIVQGYLIERPISSGQLEAAYLTAV